MENKKTEWMFFRESAVQSFIADTYMFGLIFGGFFANAFYFGGKWYIYSFFMFLGIMSAAVRSKNDYHKFTDKKELKKFVDEL